MSERVILKRGDRATRKAAPKRKPAARKSARSAVKLPWAGITATLVAIAALGTAWLYDLHGKLWLAAANIVADAGFEVRNVEVNGASHMEKLPLYTAALDGASDSMLLVDLDRVKVQLENLPWIDHASVGRRLPDTLVIDVTERTPAAIWQNDGRHMLIDDTGRVIATHGFERFAGLPLVVDEGADKAIGELLTLLRDYPTIAENFAAATRRGERRWDLLLKSGETVHLPEGQKATRKALDNFVRLDRDTGLTGRGFATLDFRVGGQMVVRVSREPGAGFETIGGTEI